MLIRGQLSANVCRRESFDAHEGLIVFWPRAPMQLDFLFGHGLDADLKRMLIESPINGSCGESSSRG